MINIPTLIWDKLFVYAYDIGGCIKLYWYEHVQGLMQKLRTEHVVLKLLKIKRKTNV